MLLLCTLPGGAHAQISASEVLQRLGYPPSSKLLILHADDFGVAHSVNQATEEALEKGWITSASMMVPCPWFPEAAKFAREHPDLDIGLHLTLTSEWTPVRWGPVSQQPVPSLLDESGYFPPSELTAAAQETPVDIAREIRAQIAKARAAGVHFTHLDTHMFTLFQTQGLFRVYQDAGHEYGIPNMVAVEDFGPDGKSFSIAAGRIVLSRDFQISPGVPVNAWFETYKKMLSGLRPGVYQLIVHLGHDDEELRGMTFDKPGWWDAAWRHADLDMVRNPKFHQFLKEEGFVLVTWRQQRKLLGARI